MDYTIVFFSCEKAILCMTEVIRPSGLPWLYPCKFIKQVNVKLMSVEFEHVTCDVLQTFKVKG